MWSGAHENRGCYCLMSIENSVHKTQTKHQSEEGVIGLSQKPLLKKNMLSFPLPC